LAGNNISEMIYFMSSGTLNLLRLISVLFSATFIGQLSPPSIKQLAYCSEANLHWVASYRREVMAKPTLSKHWMELKQFLIHQHWFRGNWWNTVYASCLISVPISCYYELC